MKHKLITTYICSILLLISGNLYADQHLTALEKKLNLISVTVTKICKAPSKEKSSYYKVFANGKIGFNVKFTDIKSKVSFTKEEWNGFQRVLRKDQASDNKNYRDCSDNLSNILIANILSPKKNEQKGTIIYNQSTSGKQSSIFNQPTGTIIFK